MPSAHQACHLGFFEHKNAAVAALWAFLSCLIFAASAQAQVSLLVPSQPSVEAPAPRPKTEAPAKREDKKDEKRPQEAKAAAAKADQPADLAAKPQDHNGSEGKPAANGGAAKRPAR